MKTVATAPGAMAPAGTTICQLMLLMTVPILPCNEPPTWQV
jgi:hypothetical protein